MIRFYAAKPGFDPGRIPAKELTIWAEFALYGRIKGVFPRWSSGQVGIYTIRYRQWGKKIPKLGWEIQVIGLPIVQLEALQSQLGRLMVKDGEFGYLNDRGVFVGIKPVE